MPDLEAIQQAVAEGKYQYSIHALLRSNIRQISRAEIEEAISCAEIIEDYPTDKYGPSCLLYGDTESGRPLHVQITCDPLSVKIITVYVPDPSEWDNNRTRKTP